MGKNQDQTVLHHRTESEQTNKVTVRDDHSSSPEPISPKAFLRSRRPERYSDSTFAEERPLDRNLLELRLDTLTSRGQETDFERFARRLAERELCPNLLPQTGPRGGGDSKVDSETYPVAEQLAFAWFIGKGTEASHERWAFAFSAAKEWKPKAKGDIEKIASTKRGYTKAIFVTNQFVPDRKRAEFEDRLSNAHELDVRVLDRSWILDRVFSGNHVDLVEDELKLRVKARHVIRKGPLDTEREGELEEADTRIDTAVREERYCSALVDDALSTAELARGLERPRHEVEGRFKRAERLALRYGTRRQRVEVAYQEAWTAFWWYEDETAIPDLYMKVEERAKGSRNVYDIERLVSLWHILEGCIDQKHYLQQPTWLEERAKTVTAELERLAGEKTRPSTALQAEMFLLIIQLRERQAAGEPLGPILKKLERTIEGASRLTGFPLDLTIQVIAELGKYLDTEPEYENLFETAVRVSSEQKQKLTTARLLVQRGRQFLESGRPYDAIRILGRSLRLLFNHSGRYEAVQALYLCGIAYKRVGLLWAARGVLVAAASLATDEFWRYGKITHFQSSCYEILKWIELKIGRLPQVLSWHATNVAATSALVARGEPPAELAVLEKDFDALLGILLLRTRFSDLRWLKHLPDGLLRLNLVHASVALVYALGHEDVVMDSLGCGKDECENYFVALSRQPAATDLPASPSLWIHQRVTLCSRVLGCEYRVDSDNVLPCVEIAESILAALEALLASAPITQAFAKIPELPIKVRKSDFAEWPFSVEVTEVAGRPQVEVRARPFNPHQITPDEQVALRSAIHNAVIQIMVHSLRIRDVKKMLAQLGDEEAFDRAVNFTSSFVAVGNVLGNNPPQNLGVWEEGQLYSLRRSKQWNAGIAEPEQLTKRSASNERTVKHSEMRTVSLIREGLWDKANWLGMLFYQSQNGSELPILAPYFADAKAGRKIFEELLNEIGRDDITNKLRLTIIRGIDRTRPHAYKVLVGTNTEKDYSNDGGQYVATVYRIRDVNSSDGVNLNLFIENYRQHQACILAPGFCINGKTPQFDLKFHIIKRNVQLRYAWQIGRHDPDAAAIGPDDEPIVPTGIENPPVLELLAYLRKQDDAPQRTSQVDASD